MLLGGNLPNWILAEIPETSAERTPYPRSDFRGRMLRRMCLRLRGALEGDRKAPVSHRFRKEIEYPTSRPSPRTGPRSAHERTNSHHPHPPDRRRGRAARDHADLSGPEGNGSGCGASTLVEVAADERPPVCKILDYGKMRFASSQKNNKTTRVRQQKLKEIRLRPKTDNHDLETMRPGSQVSRTQRQGANHPYLPGAARWQHQDEDAAFSMRSLEKLVEVTASTERPPT